MSIHKLSKFNRNPANFQNIVWLLATFWTFRLVDKSYSRALYSCCCYSCFC